MSIHSSLRGVNTLTGERSVFTRKERLAVLKKAGKFNEETGSVYGLQKVRTRYKVAGAKKAAPKAEAAAAGGAAKPAAGDKKAPEKKK